MIIVNLKKYVTGRQAAKIIEICNRVSHEFDIRIVAAVQPEDLQIGCWTQHFYLPEIPTLLNHSDYPLTLERRKAQGSGHKAEKCICTKSVEEGVDFAKLKPEWLAFEPPELIGNTEKSVASERPEEIQRLASSVQCSVLVGAGIHTAQDVRTALELGAKGVLVATAVVKAENPEEKLRELAEAFKM